jgi:hypothetical protein
MKLLVKLENPNLEVLLVLEGLVLSGLGTKLPVPEIADDNEYGRNRSFQLSMLR